MTTSSIELILFDLGGVLFRNASVLKINEWLPAPLPLEVFKDKWIHSKTVRDFESARISEADFARSLIREFGLRTTPENLISEFRGFLTGYFDGAEELLSQLACRYKLATLSNTNAVHWKTLMEHFDLNRYIDLHFPSHLTGLLKPDSHAYLHVLDTLHLKAPDVIYFDDDPTNVAAGAKAGLNAFMVNGVAGVKECLRSRLNIDVNSFRKK